MADGDFDERTPLMQHTDDGGDDDADTTGRFQPGGTSTPGPSGESYPMTTMSRPPEQEGHHTAETSFIEGNTELSSVHTAEAKAWGALTGIFPEARAIDLEVSYSKSGKLQVKKVGFGKTFMTCSQKKSQLVKKG